MGITYKEIQEIQERAESLADILKQKEWMAHPALERKTRMHESIINMIKTSDLSKEQKNDLLNKYNDDSVLLLSDESDLDKVYNKYQTMIQNRMKNSGGYRNLNMNAKDVKELCKAHQIKLSRVVNDKRVAYTKKELITKLKRKKLL